MSNYRAMTANGAVVDARGDSPAEGMADAASRCSENDWPIALYAINERGAWTHPVWGGRRGLASEYPPGQSPEDARRLFGQGSRPGMTAIPQPVPGQVPARVPAGLAPRLLPDDVVRFRPRPGARRYFFVRVTKSWEFGVSTWVAFWGRRVRPHAPGVTFGGEAHYVVKVREQELTRLPRPSC